MNTPTRGLTAEQLDLLMRPLNGNRVQEHKGQSHLEAWDVRRWLTRVFGYAGWSDEILACELVHQSIWPVTDGKGEPVPGKHRATVVYRVTLRLVVKDVHGTVLNAWDDVATGEAVNQASVGDAHDLAIKAAVSQALKRCAVNLGDQFGLSLYNDGSVQPVVVRTVGHPHVARPCTDQAQEDAPVLGGELAGQDQAMQPETQVSKLTGADNPGDQAGPSFWDTDEGRKLLKLLHTLIAVKYGPKSDDERHAGMSRFTGREITSAKQLTRDEAEKFVAALREQPDWVKPPRKEAGDNDDNFHEAEALLKIEEQQDQARIALEDGILDAIQSSENYGELTSAMNTATAARDDGRLTPEQFNKLAEAADQRAANASRTAVPA